MSILDIHVGKRMIIGEDKYDLGNGKVLCLFLAKSIAPDKVDSVVHIQKGSENSQGVITPVRGGIMIDTKLLPFLKSAIDKFYLQANEDGLI